MARWVNDEGRVYYNSAFSVHVRYLVPDTLVLLSKISYNEESSDMLGLVHNIGPSCSRLTHGSIDLI